ncbi:unnamed protein product, partial [Ectocarpus sp. 12 AP-2014]
MFSSGSEASPRNDRDYGRGTSSVTSTMDDAFESSRTAVKAGGPLMSPVLRTLASSGSGLAEGMMMPVEEVPILPDPAGDTGGLVVAALRAAGRGQQFVPLEPPDIEAPRSTAAGAHHGRGRLKQQQQQHATGESDMSETSENAEGGAHLSGGLPLPVGSVGPGVPNGGVDGRRGSPRRKKTSDIGGGGGGGGSGGNGSSGSSSGSPSRVRRRGIPPSEEPENDVASETGKGNKRRHAPPTPKHRVLSGAWGKLAAPERPAAAAANEEQGGREEQGKDDCATSCGSRSSSEFTSNSNEAGSSVDSRSAAAAAAA